MWRPVMAKPVRRKPRKTYSKPTLIVYGTVRDLTQKTGTKGKLDGGTTLGRRHSHL
jgi:hypothetical protein